MDKLINLYFSIPTEEEQKDISESSEKIVTNIRLLEMAPFCKCMVANSIAPALTATILHGCIELFPKRDGHVNIWEKSAVTTAISVIEHLVLRTCLPSYRYGFQNQRQVVIEMNDEMLNQSDKRLLAKINIKFCKDSKYYTLKAFIIFILASIAHELSFLMARDPYWLYDVATSSIVTITFNLLVEFSIYYCNL